MAADGLVKGGELGIFTPMYLISLEKWRTYIKCQLRKGRLRMGCYPSGFQCDLVVFELL
ncbi:MAG: hypothetical protein GY751_08290 [Bacteroidetes bacterium]|nr:hypothetical protein [Bacteroidota bacterium]